MIDIDAFRDYCLSLSGSEERMPFEKFFRGKHSFFAFYVRGRMYCYFDIDAFDKCNIKCDPDLILRLKERYAAVTDPYNLSHKYWIGVCFHKDMDDQTLKALVKASYERVRDGKK